MLIWFIIGSIFLLIELFTYSFISIWFAIAAYITMLFYNFLTHYEQFYLFVILSLLLFSLIRNLISKNIRPTKMFDRIIKQNVVIDKVEIKGSREIYTVYLDGKFWECISSEKLELNELVQVEKIQGNKLILKRSDSI